MIMIAHLFEITRCCLNFVYLIKKKIKIITDSHHLVEFCDFPKL